MPTSVKEMLAAANAAVPRIGFEEAAALMADGTALVVDVRDAPELQAGGKVKGAVQVSRGMLEFRADPGSPYHDKAFDPDRTVLVYCGAGSRAALAGKTLQDLGYRDVRNLGGFKDWADHGGATESA
jgi:rhodanese-related sulfurtransferase